MKFAKELDEGHVPEWRYKYLDYKQGKKKIKAVSRALREANKTPYTPARSDGANGQIDEAPDSLPYTHYDFNKQPKQRTPQSGKSLRGVNRPNVQQRRHSLTMFAKSPPVLLPDKRKENNDSEPQNSETQPLSRAEQGRVGRYGSFEGASIESSGRMHELELPDPAMKPSSSRQPPAPTNKSDVPSAGPKDPPKDGATAEIVRASPGRRASLAQRLFQRRQTLPTPGKPSSHVFSKSSLRKVFRPHELDSPYADEVQLEAYEKLDARQAEFFEFLDKELRKVEDFYLMKEDEASSRLNVLRQQLHELRDRRIAELQKAQGNGTTDDDGAILGNLLNSETAQKAIDDFGNGNGHNNPLKPIGNFIQGRPSVGRTTKSILQTVSPQTSQTNRRPEDRQDYVRRKPDAPSFRVAKRRLKMALQEFYRALELLKSYTLLNRTAFRKINKKYDKAVNARPTLRYYTEKIETAYFVQSDVIGGHLVAVEDLYARYFEKGNHKVAVNKLRSKLKGGDYSATSFRNGLYVAAGVCFGVSALTTALDRLLNPPTPDIFTETSYLLQLYGGYFLALLLFLLFCLDCKVWTTNRINYQFIFEYDTRHTLDWRQLAEIPCFFLFLNGLFLWLNFKQSHGDAFYLYWPVLLFAITLIIMALPFQIFYYQARRWWGYSNWRLFFAGLYPVEFRDFYLGDMYCSVTYSMSQIELFFCLYVNNWKDPPQCNSNHSRLMGFFTTLPAIWRALQCVRRYRDSGNWFPHMANFAKYMGNVLYYMTLSLYRIHMSTETKAAFIVFAAINGLYCSFWDVYFDWSLGSFFSKNFLLRDRLAYKKKRIYYAAVPLDVILRQQWIFYALFVEDLQHSSAVSFFVGLAEVLRRAGWSLLRVENEHCNNVGNYRAARDIPLPYKLQDDESQSSSEENHQRPTQTDSAASATGADLEQTTSVSSSVRRRGASSQTPTFRALQRVGTVIASAHAADFEKKRKPAGQSPEEEVEDVQESSDEDEDDREEMQDREDTEDMYEADKMIRRANRA
jgi:xenotropic and polytropic retrovirus receptor 1